MRHTQPKQSATPKPPPPISERPALPEPLAVRVPQAAHLLQISERTAWSLLRAGRLTASRVGGLTLVHMASIHALLGDAR